MDAAQNWSKLPLRKQRRVERMAAFADGRVLRPDRIVAAL